MEGGAYTGRFNSTGGQVLAAHFIELLRFFNNKVDNFPIEDFWNMLDSTMSMEERETSNKKRAKNAKKRYAKFNPSHIKRPKTAMNLYRIDYKAKVITDGKEYSNEEFNKVWANIDNATLEKYNKLYQEKMEQYNKDYEAAMKQAILDGEYEAPEPKKPLSGYFLYLDFCRRDGSTLLTNDQQESIKGLSLTESTKQLTEYYNEFIKNEDNVKLLEYSKEQYRTLYNYNYYHWNVTRMQGVINRLQRENKDTKYKELELQEYKNSIEFDVSTEPTINVEWIYSFNKTDEPSDTDTDANDINDTQTNDKTVKAKTKTKAKESKAKSKPRVKSK
jgi:hypothetical protein